MDYRLTDVHADPPADGQNARPLYTEELVRLPVSAWCWEFPPDAPPVGREDGPLTFACLSNFAKVSDSMLELWGRIVAATPGSKLLLKAYSLATPSVRQRVFELLIGTNVEQQQIELIGDVVTYKQHLELYRRIDIVLDTFRYHGTTTTCEALSMGVPVVSLVGDHHISRVSASLLATSGLAEFLARSPAEYVEAAVRLAGDADRREKLRATLRDRLARSPLTDARRFTKDVEIAYRTMWRRWCEGQ